MSMLFAATYPERTTALILCGAEVKEETTDDWPWGEWTREEFEDVDRDPARPVGQGIEFHEFSAEPRDDP